MKMRGFTILELLLALSVFAVVSLLAFQGLQSVIASKLALDQARESLRAVNLGVGVMARDLASAVWRPSRDGNNRALASLSGDALHIEFARISAGSIAPGVERVRYSLIRGTLVRERFPGGDPAPGPASERRNLLSGVTRVQWRYALADGGWAERFPAPDSIPAQAMLPRAVEVNLAIEGVGEVRRVVLLPDGSLPEQTR